MEKQFVTYEIALKLKGLGFDEPCYAHFRDKDSLIAVSSGIAGIRYSWIENKDVILSPLWQQVIDWFRDNKKIHISLPNHYDGNSIDIRNFNNDKSYHSMDEDKWYEDYYECRILSILKAFELI